MAKLSDCTNPTVTRGAETPRYRARVHCTVFRNLASSDIEEEDANPTVVMLLLQPVKDCNEAEDAAKELDARVPVRSTTPDVGECKGPPTPATAAAGVANRL